MDAVEVSAVSPMEIGVCLGDLYSVSWIEMAEAEDLHTWSLQKQFEAIRLRTSANHTYQYVRPPPPPSPPPRASAACLRHLQVCGGLFLSLPCEYSGRNRVVGWWFPVKLHASEPLWRAARVVGLVWCEVGNHVARPMLRWNTEDHTRALAAGRPA